MPPPWLPDRGRPFFRRHETRKCAFYLWLDGEVDCTSLETFEGFSLDMKRVMMEMTDEKFFAFFLSTLAMLLMRSCDYHVVLIM